MKSGIKKFMSFIFSLCICTSLLSSVRVNSFAVAENVGDVVLYVSPDAADNGEGTTESPISLTGAKEMLKGLKNEKATATVYLLGGTYCFDDVLCFNSEDMANVTYKAYDKEKVVFSGAYEINGFKESEVNGVKVFTKKLDTSQDNWYFKSLFSDNGEVNITRFPEEGYFTVKATAPEDDLWNEENRPWEFTYGQRSFYANTEDIPSKFHNEEDVNIRILHYWHDELMNIKSYNAETGKIGLSRPSTMEIRDIDRYYFENVFEALNEPGEWYLDKVSGILYYVPKEGEKADTLTLYGSNIDRLIDINGVDGITFEGVHFTRNDWVEPKADGFYTGTWWEENDLDFPQAAMFVDGVVSVEYAENVHFKNCEFTNLGGTAVKIKFGVKNSSVENCYFENIAATAIYAGGENCLPEQDNYTQNITIKNNEIYKYGRKFFSAIGIHITFCDTAEVVNNEIHDGYYTGISVGWIWSYDYNATKNVKVSRNLIYNIGQGWLSDMGGIYMLGKQPGTVLSENVIHNVAADPGEGGYGGWGIYLDEGSSYMTVEKNLVYACGNQSFNVHYGEGNVIRNNIAALSGEGLVSPGVDRGETHATAVYYNNVFLTYNKAPIYIEMLNPSHFYDNGNLMWSLTEGDELYFDTSENIYTLKMAQDKGFIHFPTVADPGFKDALNFDFTLAEDSPAFALNFEAWDYSLAGTIKDTVIGLDREGGKTPYNAESELQPDKEFKHNLFASYIPYILFAFPVLLALVWLIIGAIKGKKTVTLPILVAVISIPLFVAVYFLYLEWIEILYFLSVFALAALASVLPTCVAIEKGKTKKGIILAFVVNFILSAGVFLGLAGILNMLLRSGSPEVISITCGAMFIYMVVETIRLLKVYKKKDK
ncbi:MAG: right-handed parallel beta-helix repeat-containing protein [Clostridia bacterium]|nr:right-handed parallel beta-helix repeat-containing protein [Clostridia bacterium]